MLGRNQAKAKIRAALLPLTALVLGLGFVLSACSSSAGDTTPTATGSGSPSGSPAGGSPTEMPAAECAPAQGMGLVSQVAFNTSGGSPAGGGTFDPGQPIEITLILVNCGNADSTLYFPSTQRYSFYIQDPQGNEVWRSSDGKVYGQTEGTEILSSNKTQRYTETWDQKDKTGAQVPSGLYRVSAFSVGCIAAARANCEFGPVGFVQVGPTSAVTTAAPTPAPS
jgi:hypothetical protein